MLSIIMTIENDDDRGFVSALYAQFEKNLYLTASKVLIDKSFAEDCVHDTIRAVIENLGKFKGFTEINQIKYMMICCRNAAINKYNRKGKYGKLISKEEKEEQSNIEIADVNTDVCRVVVLEETKRILRSYVEMLDDKYKDIITMKIDCELDNKEIAKTLHISENLVRQRYKRAKELLRTIGGKELYGLLKD